MKGLIEETYRLPLVRMTQANRKRWEATLRQAKVL
jgi:hypothetical protein